MDSIHKPIRWLGLFGLLVSLSTRSVAQDSGGELEDRLFVSATYNQLYELPEGIKQNSFSGSFSIGYIWDVVLAHSMSYSFGWGTGIVYSANAYYHNFEIAMNEKEVTTFRKLESGDYSTNKFSTQYLEILFEFRYRKYTSDRDDFFRLYTGGKLGFLLGNESYVNKGKISRVYENHNVFNNIRLGPTLAVGYGNFTLSFYWGMSNLLNTEKKFNNIDIVIKELDVGITFYIL